MEGMTLEKLQVIIEAQTKAYYEELKKVQQQTKSATSAVERQTDKIKSAFGKIGKAIGIALSAAAIIRFGKSCIELGSDLAEVQNVVDVTFGAMSETINRFARDALEEFGLSETSAKKYSSTLGAMLKSMGFTTQAAAEMSMQMTGLAADMASFYNLDTDVAFEKIRSGISGETEPLKQLGINMSVANLEAYALSQGITKAYNSMTQQEQAMLRYNYLMSVTADAQGDFARTSDGWANQVRVLTERFNALKATIGKGLIVVFTPVIRVLNALLSKILTVTDAFSNMIAKITGKNTKTTTTAVEGIGGAADTATGSMENLGGATDKAGSSAKKAAKEYAGLASFDEIHSLTKNDDSGSGGSGSGGGAAGGGLSENIVDAANETDETLNPALEKLIERLKELQQLFKDGFKAGLGDVDLSGITKAVDGIKKSLREIFTAPEVVTAANGFANSLAYSLGQQAGAMASVGITIATNILGGINKYLDQNKERIEQHLVSMFDIGSEIVTIQGNFAQAAANIFSAFGGENAQQATANLIGIFADAQMGINELAGKIGRDVLDMITRPFIENQEGFKSTLDEFLGVAADALGNIKKVVDDTFTKANEVYDQHVAPVIAAKLEIVGNVFLKVAGVVADVVGNIFDALGGLVDFIAGVFTGDWDRAWEGIKTFFSSIWEAMKTILSTIWSAMKTIVSTAISAVSTVISTVLNTIKTIFETIWNSIKTTVATIWNAIKSVITTTINTISTTISTVLNTIKTVFSTIFTSVKTTVSTIFGSIKSTITTTMGTISSGISTALNGIKTVWANVWGTMKTTVVNIFNGIWSSIKGVINSIIGGVEKMANGVIRGLNGMIRALNRLSFDVPDWVPEIGGETFGFNISTIGEISIPRLATGGVIDKATLAMVGEAGQEAVVPLENNTGWMDKIAGRIGEIISVNLRAIIGDMDSGSEYQTIQTIVQLDSKTLVEQTDKYRRRKGYQMANA